MSEEVEHPRHYTQGEVECIDAMVSAFGGEAVRDYCRLNAFEYVWRAKEKDSVESNTRSQTPPRVSHTQCISDNNDGMYIQLYTSIYPPKSILTILLYVRTGTNAGQCYSIDK